MTDTTFRLARAADLPRLVALLADDPLGQRRESESSPVPYESAFTEIDADPNHELWVAELEGEVVGLLQLSFVPGLTYTGGWRAQIEGVRVAPDVRSRGVGRALVHHAIERSRTRGCVLVQLTTDKQRPEALAFYERLGFSASHVGLKLRLD